MTTTMPLVFWKYSIKQKMEVVAERVYCNIEIDRQGGQWRVQQDNLG